MKSLKNIFSQDLFVGYVHFVSPSFLKVHFPSSTLLNKFFNSGEGFHPGIVGEYVIIEGEDYGFLGKIVELSLPEKERLELSETSFKQTDFHPVGKIELLVCFDYYKETIKKGLNQFPPVGSKVYACSSEALSIFLKDFGSKEDNVEEILFELASIPSNILSLVNVSPDALFNRHCAIVGTTGGGKSWTVARILEQTVQNSGKAILIDATGEYYTLKEHLQDKITFANFNSSTHSTYFHYSSLRETDLYAMFRPSGQAQLPKLQEAMKSLRLVSLVKNKQQKTANDLQLESHFVAHPVFGFTTVTKAEQPRMQFIVGAKENADIYSPYCNFAIKGLANQVNKECFSDFSNDGNFGRINQQTEGHCVSLVSRILLTTSNKDFENVFGFDKDVVDNEDLRFKIDNYLKDDSKNLLIISLNKIPFDGQVKDILVNAIGRYLLEEALSEKFKLNPVLLFVDEAHQFLNNKVRDEYSIEVELNAFERIAKECRKFGLFLVLATQMPRDIPNGILSQMGTFIVHRLINESDRRAIEFACSESSRSLLSFLPVLSPGEALLTGVDFPMPFILRIIEPKSKPDSRTPKAFKKSSP